MSALVNPLDRLERMGEGNLEEICKKPRAEARKERAREAREKEGGTLVRDVTVEFIGPPSGFSFIRWNLGRESNP